MLRRARSLGLLLCLTVACNEGAEDIDDYLDAYAERGDITCKCVWDIVMEDYQTQAACFSAVEITPARRTCMHQYFDEEDDLVEVFTCRVDAEVALENCYASLCDLSKDGKMAGVSDCQQAYMADLDGCPPVTAAAKEETMECLAK
ncbi:MAG: hypothetical protein R3A79_23970 [Nannocystaceae bacterium]